MKAKRVSTVSYSTEATLSATTDDYGTSYYYRGGVKDNYMEFNNMCWRIIRVEGDGSIKIILAKEGLCSTITPSDTTSAWINKYSLIAFGSKIDNGKYRYDYENSTNGLYATLKAWYTSSGLENKKSLLKNEKWCLGGNDNYRYDPSTGALLTDAEVTEIENNRGTYYYTAGKRLYGIGTDKSATLKCSSEEDSINDYIGTITADEVAYAGGMTSATNKLYYLYDNAQFSYWTLSRSKYDCDMSEYGYESAFTDGLYHSLVVIDSSVGARPAITLATGTQITGGDGTIENPYTIE